MAERPTVAIIGGGFSGVLTALHLLRDPGGPNVRLVEKRGGFGRGAAYSTLDPAHLLNVRAANMSAFPDQPSHFTEWLAAQSEAWPPTRFVRRAQYGDYLQGLVQDAISTAAAGRFVLELDAATALEPGAAGWRVALAMGRGFDADAVVLAVGNLPPAPPGGLIPPDRAAYIADPWSLDGETLPRTGEAVLLGTGLTMVDVALHLARLRPGIRMVAISRRGLLPRRHLAEGPDPLPRPAPERPTVRGLLRQLRGDSDGVEWRAVVDGLRPHVHAIWRGWSAAQRQQFLRHARPWWDVHRHRLAPVVASSIDHLMAGGVLRVEAGGIRSLESAPGGVRVTWRSRGSRVDKDLLAAVVVNCTGPAGAAQDIHDPLLRQLLYRGLVRPDDCRLGLDVDTEGQAISRAGALVPMLFAVGPLTRGSLWEITSVPDIRVQAADRARTVLKRLRASSRRAVVERGMPI